MSTTTSEDLPEYAVTIADCGDPQPVIDELTELLGAQTAPQIMTWLLVRSEGEAEPDQPDNEPQPAEDTEGKETDETSGADHD